MTASVSHVQPEQFLIVTYITGIVGAHEQTVRHWIKSRELKAGKFGTRIGYRVKRSDFEAFLDRRTLTGAIAAQLLRSTAVAGDSERPTWFCDSQLIRQPHLWKNSATSPGSFEG